jgi:large subunit ribosomal protein L29
MKIKEIKELTNKEIQERIETDNMQLIRLKLNHSISPLDNPSCIKEARKTIARFKSELRQRELNKQ